MLYIDVNKMLIELTRSDNASIVFSAVDGEGTTYIPTEGDVLTFAVGKKLGSDPVFSISNTFDGLDIDSFWTVEIGADPTNWYQKDDNGNPIYENGEPVLLKFGDYVWDLQLTTSTGTTTIIGKTDNVSPKFRVWGEVAQ